MKLFASNFLCFVIGAAAGTVAGYLVGKKICDQKANKRADEEIEKVKERFQEELKKAYAIEPDEVEVEINSEVPANMDQNEIREKLRKNYEGTTNYAEMYRRKDQNEDDDNEEEEIIPEEDAHLEHQQNKDRKPRIISEEATGELPSYYNESVLYYYTEDETLVDDDGEVIDEPELLLGDTLTKYNFAESEEQIIFVQNFALDTCYEIQKVDGAFYEEEE